ncbi:MAG: hypothetical protein LBR79_06310 [Oscillospiraceae bacterium]|nr:hypothetical protein [Oscillospiraceae bacterium]
MVLFAFSPRHRRGGKTKMSLFLKAFTIPCKIIYNRPVRKFYRLQSKSTTAYKNTPRRF